MNKIFNRDEISAGIKSKHIIMCPDEKEISLNIENVSEVKGILDSLNSEELKAYILGEEIKNEEHREPLSIREMRRLQLVDYEPASDSGHFRFYPKGFLISELLKMWADKIAVEKLKAIQIESPLIYNWDDPDIREQGGSFHENHYRVSAHEHSDKYFVLRFAGDFGLFKIMKQAKFSHKMLPLRVYEFSKSFRYERRGALSGLKRLRAFQMPDIHCFCRDISQGWEEYKLLYIKYLEMAEEIGVPYAVGFRIIEEFYKKYKDRIMELIRYSGKPAYVEILSGMKHYWAVKHEFQGIDSVGGSVQLSTVQLDIKDSDIYGIKYSDKDGSDKSCIICHSSIGSIERWIYCLLENSVKLRKPVLPYWLSPCQLRLIPVSDRHVDFCEKLNLKNIRLDIDDRSESLNKKIVMANKEWIPFYSVIGDKEMNSGEIKLNSRYSSESVEGKISDINHYFEKLQGNMPYKDLSLPKRLSLHPVFFG